MPQPIKAIVITGNGTNCEMEMAHACRLAGFDDVEIVHISELLCGEKRLDDYHFLNLPGGFLDGDDLGSAKAGANRILHAAVAGSQEKLFAQFTRFIAAGKLILGVCNGFQLLVKLGMLPGFDGQYDRQTATLTFNDSGRFEDRWVHLRVDAASPCVFTKGLKGLTLPVRHGEGKFVPLDEEILGRLHREHLICLQYSDERSEQATLGLPGEPQRLRGRDRRDLQRNGPDLRPDAPPGGLPPPDQPSPLDPGGAPRRGDGTRPLPERRRLSPERRPVAGHRPSKRVRKPADLRPTGYPLFNFGIRGTGNATQIGRLMCQPPL